MRKLMHFAIGFALASLAGSMIYGQWVLLAGAGMFLLTGLLLIFHKRDIIKQLIVVAFGIAVGFTWFFLHDMFFVLVPRVADGQTVSVTIEASDYSYETDYGSAVEGNAILNDQSYRIKAYLHIDDAIKPGDRLTGTFRLRLTAMGGKEDPTSHQSEGIFLLAYPVGKTLLEPCKEIPWRHYPAVWRRHLLDRIDTIFTGRVEAFASALVLGDRSKITYEMNTAFKLSGISHIIAVSGMHVSILFGLLYSLLARRRILSFLIGVPVLFLFAAMVGFSPSITRACIMQALMLLAMALDREYDPPTALAFAVLAMLTANPLTVLSVSFQLSVGCMIGIFLFSERIRLWIVSRLEKKEKKSKFRSKMVHGIAASVAVSLSATIITTPFVAYHFGCVILVSVLTNLMVMWVISFIFYGIVLCLVASMLSLKLAVFISLPVSVPIYFVLYTSKYISKLPFAAIYTASIYTAVWFYGAYILLSIFLLQKRNGRCFLQGVFCLRSFCRKRLLGLNP